MNIRKSCLWSDHMDETLFKLDKDGYYILYIILYIILYYNIIYQIMLYYIILYYIILNFILNNYKPIITGNFFSSNDALFVKEHLNHVQAKQIYGETIFKLYNK